MKRKPRDEAAPVVVAVRLAIPPARRNLSPKIARIPKFLPSAAYKGLPTAENVV